MVSMTCLATTDISHFMAWLAGVVIGGLFMFFSMMHHIKKDPAAFCHDLIQAMNEKQANDTLKSCGEHLEEIANPNAYQDDPTWPR